MLVPSFLSSFYIFDVIPLLDVGLVKIFVQSVGCSILLTVSFSLQKLFNFMRPHLSKFQFLGVPCFKSPRAKGREGHKCLFRKPSLLPGKLVAPGSYMAWIPFASHGERGTWPHWVDFIRILIPFMGTLFSGLNHFPKGERQHRRLVGDTRSWSRVIKNIVGTASRSIKSVCEARWSHTLCVLWLEWRGQTEEFCHYLTQGVSCFIAPGFFRSYPCPLEDWDRCRGQKDPPIGPRRWSVNSLRVENELLRKALTRGSEAARNIQSDSSLFWILHKTPNVTKI